VLVPELDPYSWSIDYQSAKLNLKMSHGGFTVLLAIVLDAAYMYIYLHR